MEKIKKNNKDYKLLLITDIAGFGKVALSVMIPILSRLGFSVYNAPTAIVSNTLDYGKFAVLDTSDYLHDTFKTWEKLRINYDVVATGFLTSDKQAEIIYDYCKSRKEQMLIFVDPIMGDDGFLYNGVSLSIVNSFQKLISIADYIVPNFTEALILAKMEYKKEGISKEEVLQLITSLKVIGAKNIIITSAIVEKKHVVIVYDDLTKNITYLGYDVLDVRFPGTGDIFLSYFMNSILNEKSVVESTKDAMLKVETLMKLNITNEDKFQGIKIESSLEVLEHDSKN
jgi:pyridoxine kinase